MISMPEVKNNEVDGRIKAFFLKGFDAKEIAQMLNLKIETVEKALIGCDKRDINQNSNDLYSELQKDLSKLVLTELNKEKRDPSVVLNAIKLQAELQEKKISLTPNKSSELISKNYIYKRDEDIENLKKEGVSEEDIAKRFAIGVQSVRQALDRCSLNLPEESRNLSPSVISETIGLDKDTRLKILADAASNQFSRTKVREVVNKIKNATR